MNSYKISEEVMKIIRAKTEDDDVMKRFIEDLIFKERSHSGMWWHFKDEYKTLINKYSMQWDEKQ